jgi:NADH-quinone oxidoreductase subunit A
MPENYLPIAVFIIIVSFLAVALVVVGVLVRPHNPNAIKESPYECGIEPVGDARDRFTVRYYIIAMLFVLFDIETVFMYPWAVIYNNLGLYGLVEMVLFIAILVVAYVYAWRKGALEWV